MDTEQNIKLMPSDPDTPDARPKGLLDQLLEEGAVYRDFVMAGETFRVETTARFEPGQVCFFRCAVSHQGTELTEAPWAPIFRNLSDHMAALGTGTEARFSLARQALEAHLSFCQRVEAQLEARGVLTEPSGMRTHVHWAYPTVIAMLITAAGSWYGFERWKLRIPAPIDVKSVADVLPPAEAVAEVTLVPPAPTETDADDIYDSSRHATKVTPEPSPPPASARPVETATSAPRKSPGPNQKPVLAKRSPPATSLSPPLKASTSHDTTPPVRAIPPVQAPAPLPSLTSHPASTHPSDVVAVSTLIGEIVPSNHQRLHLEPGAQIYRDSSIRISDIPRSYLQLPCVTTVSRQGDTEQGILLRLKRPARVLVAHDLRVKKKPEWLASFQATGDRLRALEVDRGKSIDYAIFRRDVPAGAVALGSNTRIKRLKRKLREFLPGKSPAMYLVCLAETDGKMPAPSSDSRRKP